MSTIKSQGLYDAKTEAKTTIEDIMSFYGKSVIYAKNLPLFDPDDFSKTVEFFNRLLEPYDQEPG